MAAGYTTGTTASAWDGWVTSNTITYTTSATCNVWYAWNTYTASSTTASISLSNWAWSDWSAQKTETQEQKALREERDRQYRAQEAERQARWAAEAKQREEAGARAEKLLKENLAEEERARYERAGYFYVRSKSGKLYKVKKGSHGNVYRLNPATQEEEERYCVQPVGVPVGDMNLAQKLYLEHDEDEFLRKANVIWRAPARQAA